MILRESSIDFVVANDPNEKKQTGQRKYKTWKLKWKGAPGSVEHLSLVLKEMKGLKKSLMLSRIKGLVTSGQARLH